MKQNSERKIYVKTLHFCCIVHLIIAHHTISLQCYSRNVRHCAFSKYSRARFCFSNTRNSVRRHAHLCQDVCKRIILKKNKKKLLQYVKQCATIYSLVRNARLHFVLKFDDLSSTMTIAMVSPKPLVKWYHDSLQNCKFRFDSVKVCHRHSNDMCGSSGCEVGQVAETSTVL